MATNNKIRTRPCKHYFSNRGCKLGDACNFMHETKPSLDESRQIDYKIHETEGKLDKLFIQHFMHYYAENEESLREPARIWFEQQAFAAREIACIQRYMDDALNSLRDSVEDLTAEQEQDAYNFVYGQACQFGFDEVIHEMVDKSLDEDSKAMAAFRSPSMAQIVKVVPRTPKKEQIVKVAPWAPVKAKREIKEGELWGDFEYDNDLP